ncbi:hypothetical protein [Nostoc sp. ChiQUE01b]|nr:hypothetical protein [Nostoc sp. ChiQUE01b]MDZ8258998.1 hypothetical protein [Nostoc sp. ChiQUE01b]HYW18866.1 hypothetical protein [Nodularia sp. (in: cyanobacteria)]
MPVSSQEKFRQRFVSRYLSALACCKNGDITPIIFELSATPRL